MSDIDFDELDKAVNSLMTNVDTTKRNEALDDPEDTVVTLDATEPVSGGESVSVPEAVSASTVPASALAQTASTSPALAVKRRGQFMDVMHPSSDMKAAKPIKRQGATIAPPAASAIVPEPSNEPTSNAPTPDSGAIEADTPEAPSEQSPLTSPFLPDAKPEKRPLGVASDAGVVSTIDIAAELDNELVADARNEQVELPPEPPALPEELHTDIMAVEATDTTATEPTELAENPDELTEQAAEETTIAVPAGGSIAQQYTEAPSSGDQTNGSIYDTSNYHQPIEAAPTAKKSSPLKWILLAVGLLVLGGGGGVVYFLLTH
ncbi:MAG: hypothetical protein ACM3KF_02335 [Acidobacteriota bacterium]